MLSTAIVLAFILMILAPCLVAMRVCRTARLAELPLRPPTRNAVEPPTTTQATAVASAQLPADNPWQAAISPDPSPAEPGLLLHLLVEAEMEERMAHAVAAQAQSDALAASARAAQVRAEIAAAEAAAAADQVLEAFQNGRRPQHAIPAPPADSATQPEPELLLAHRSGTRPAAELHAAATLHAADLATHAAA